MAPSPGMAVPPSNPALSWNSSSDLTQARYWHLTGLAQGVIFLMTREHKAKKPHLFTSTSLCSKRDWRCQKNAYSMIKADEEMHKDGKYKKPKNKVTAQKYTSFLI